MSSFTIKASKVELYTESLKTQGGMLGAEAVEGWRSETVITTGAWSLTLSEWRRTGEERTRARIVSSVSIHGGVLTYTRSSLEINPVAESNLVSRFPEISTKVSRTERNRLVC